LSSKSKIIIFVTFIITLIVAVGGFFYLYVINPTQETEVEEKDPSCLEEGECEFQDCNKQKVYKQNCEFEIQEGFCCNGYNSPTDRCQKKLFCAGQDETFCEKAGEEFKTCDRCSIGKSSLVKVKQSAIGCEYEYEICKPDIKCGEIPENDNIEGTQKQCADDREIGDEWKECCIGEDLGKSRTIRKNDDCSLIIISPCAQDQECEAKSTPTPTPRSQQTNRTPVPQSTQEDQNISPTLTPTQQDQPAATQPTQQDQTTTPSTTQPTQQGQTTTPSITQPTQQGQTTTPSITQPTAVQPTQSTQQDQTTTPSTTQPTQQGQTTTPSITQPTQQGQTTTPSITQPTAVQPTQSTQQDQPQLVDTDIDLETLPRTDMHSSQIIFITIALLFIACGIYISQDPKMAIALEERIIDIRYKLFPNQKNRQQEKRTQKLFEQKLSIKEKKKEPKN
jgi:hypothetical protein